MKKADKDRKRGVYIQDTDIDLFRFLSSGASTLGQILDNLRKRKKKVSNGYINIRLSLLRSNGYIKSNRYHNREKGGRGWFALYVLDKLAEDELVRAGYRREHIRNRLPAKNMVAHNMLETDVVRAIKREAGKTLYTFDIRDEYQLRSHDKGAQKGEVYPDLRVILYFDWFEKPCSYELEIDNDTIDPPLIAAKVAVRREGTRTIVLCNTTERITALRRAFGAYHRRHPEKNLKTMVAFVLIADFCLKGFFGSNPMAIDGSFMRILPPKKET